MELVVADPFGDEASVIGGDQRHGYGTINELAVDVRPEPRGLLGARELEALGSGDLTVDGRVAEPARVLPALKPLAAEMQRDEVSGRRELGVPASGDHLGAIAGVACDSEEGRVRDDVEGGPVSESPERGDNGSPLVEEDSWLVGVEHGDLHPSRA